MRPHERWNSKFQIKKGAWVFIPTKETIDNGLQIKKLIEKHWSFPKYYFHLIKGGHVRALHEHKKHKFFIHLDIKNFFGQINRSRVTRSLKEYVSYEKAREIAVESTVRLPESTEVKYILPFGFVQSPIIASICLSKSALGRHLTSLKQQNEYAVSIYMDDILVSANNSEKLMMEIMRIKAASEKSKLLLNAAKQVGPDTRIKAFNIEISQDLLQITPSKLQELANTYATSENDHQRAGIFNYVLSVNPSQVEAFLQS
ncbi:reverse transcriptase domain-containing protein [Nitrosomonas halophila]|uniref:Reverse transcriptase (RNA-dependent DNA polymerase) n=1 Tax=Nitrosomonas halophila TaxID=44576 RepID=A0A1H3PXH4_9PROT|nr:reverse transcriptase domain-containing protein [Nitrosomonas halophila]SDZ05786.1 Reverse transcriptase (RNA-dependent DNA polymerase) [Nitrosomonas halophila]